MYGDRNSKAASDFAAKRKAQMERAQVLKDSRDRQKLRNEVSTLTDDMNSMYVTSSSLSSSKDHPRSNDTRFDTDLDVLGSSSSSNQGSTKQRSVAADLKNDAMIVKSRSTARDTTSSSVKIETYNDTAGHMIAERIIIRSSGTKPTNTIHTQRITTTNTKSSSHRSSDHICSPYHHEPINPAGRRIDISDRPIMCSASNHREVCFGGSDHMIHCINPSDTKKPTLKLAGHTDWLTTLALTCDDRLVSGGMDGNLLLWSTDRKRHHVMIGGHSKSISKVVADPHKNIIVSGGYDGLVAVWSPAIASSSSSSAVARSSKATSSRTPAPSIEPIAILRAKSSDPIIDCVLYEGIISIGNRAGKVIAWDINTNTAITSINAHAGPINTILNPGHPNMLVSAGIDGYIKSWDLRCNVDGTGMISKTFAHYGRSPSASQDSQPVGMATTHMAMVDHTGSGSLSYLLSVGADNAVVLQDLRKEGEIVYRIDNHCRHGIQSLTVADASSCVLVGDGAGMAMCYNLLSGELMYGLGACESGGVSVMHAFDKKLITGGEDGKVMVYNYN